MKLGLIAIATVLASAIAAPASAECIYPKAPDSVPNGSTATKDEMTVGVTAFKKYDAEVTTYLSCLDQEADTRVAEAGENADQVKQIKAMTVKKHNAAVDELQSHAQEINSQLRAFKNKNKG